ncbi:hypothetical protein JIM95_005575 [Corynebacterium sp. CCM 8835]|uniref:Uncharacterized protein n=1 Tax=Corynebacterium antarcticum TaxID=2800405 RepID=A0ABS1FKX6_9CORY|nr:hypothetical protein [Corynebacterium antarcticum]MCK7642452.1 hypothetical protein [Corynebacterium antarcticum]MCK7660863.1 hypothetical protein [Corynebacterium antarcticum]MCL0245610.1 hypothetical protein [Corynebacterium antarcticum]MCX7491933.1 hypothetical protein [Corynebacterium antarcticum]
MSEKKLTVAELMARAAAEEGREDTPRPRRRRRRSLDEGGVSVAELTGSIPAVDSKPAESRHSSVPLDDADRAADETPTGPQTVARHSSPVVGETEGPTAVPTRSDAGEDDVTPSTGDADVPGGVDAGEAPATASTAPTDVPRKDSADAADAAPEATRPSSDETVVLSVVTDEDPVRLTTGEFPQITPRQVQQERAKDPAPEVPPATGDAPVAVPDEDAVNEARTPAVNEVPPTTEMTAVATEEPEPRSPVAPEDAGVAQEGQDGAAEQGKVSVAAVFGMILLGLIVGVALFFGFEKLWGHFNTAVTAVLAIAVTGGIIGIVHALRTERDGLSMFLAGLAGLAVTFGPLLTA